MITIKTIEVYVTEDGKQFQDKAQAEKYEAKLNENKKILQKVRDIKEYCKKYCTGNEATSCGTTDCPLTGRAYVGGCKLCAELGNMEFGENYYFYPKDWEV